MHQRGKHPVAMDVPANMSMNPLILLLQRCWLRLYVKKIPVIYGNWAKPQTQHAEFCSLKMQ
jgi:hypothetical protein